MVEIKAFGGLRYKDVDFQKVITPPYDVIDDDMKKRFQELSEYNFVNLILNDDHNKAKELFNEWINKKILVKDEDSLYIYQQEFKLDNKIITRTGFICLLKIEDFGKNILPHEKTFDKYINDRFDLMVKTRSNLENIFLIYQDRKKEIDSLIILSTEKEENIKFIDDDNCVHKIWKIDNGEVIEKIVSLMSDKKLLIADGHHRYKTALKYRKEHGNEYVMATLVNSFNEGVVILPTNRLVNEKVNIEDFSDYFDVKEADEITNLEEKSFIVSTKEKKYLIKLREEEILNEVFKDNEIFKNLDVAILHNLIFEKILKIPMEEQKPPKIKFVKGNKLTIDSINDSNTAFFVRCPSLEQTFNIANTGKVMPQKSTYFYPKMFSGLVIYRIGS